MSLMKAKWTILYSFRRLPFLALLLIAALFSPQTTFSQGTPWIAEPRTGSISLSYFNQNAKEFWRGDQTVKGPLEATGASLGQNTVWINVNYALGDAIAVDLQTAWAQSYVDGAVGPSGGEENYSGLFDTNVSLTYRLIDELVSNNAPSIAGRVGFTIPGGYDTGYINSLGDGASGFEASIIVGKFFSVVGASGEVGLRVRGSTSVNSNAVGAGANSDDVDVPNEIFLNFSVYVPLGNRLRVDGIFSSVNATSGIDIGGEGFSPSRFPSLEEDRSILGGRLFADLFGSVSANLFFGSVVGGRNTAKSTVIGGGLSVGLGGGFGGGL